MSNIMLPSPRYSGEGLGVRGFSCVIWVADTCLHETAICRAYPIFELMVNRAPHPRPLPGVPGRGEMGLFGGLPHHLAAASQSILGSDIGPCTLINGS